MSAGDVIEHNESKHRFLVVGVIPYSIRIRSVWGYYSTIGKRRLSEFTKIGVKPDYIQRWQWFGEAEEK